MPIKLNSDFTKNPIVLQIAVECETSHSEVIAAIIKTMSYVAKYGERRDAAGPCPYRVEAIYPEVLDMKIAGICGFCKSLRFYDMAELLDSECSTTAGIAFGFWQFGDVTLEGGDE